MTQIEHAPAGSINRFVYEMREGSRREVNVIFALMFRELKSRSGTEGNGLLSLIGIVAEPVFAALLLAGFWYVIRRTEIQGVSVFLFMAVSYTPFSVFRRAITSIPRSIRSSRSFYAFQSVKPIDAVLARFIVELALTMIGGIILLFLLSWFGDLTINRDKLLEAIGLFAALLVGSLGVSLLVGVYGTRFPLLFKVLQMTARGLLFVSCVLHPASELPSDAQAAITWNPLAHFEELFRNALIGTQPFQDASLTYLLMWSLVLLFFGMLGYHANRHKVIER